MKLLFKFSIFAASLALLAVSAIGQATPIEATYTINLHSSDDDGLTVYYQDVADNPFNFNLNPGEQVNGPLFRIWTDEHSINNDDTTPMDIAAIFDFTLPEIFGGKVTGATVGGRVCFGIFGCPDQWGEVDWDGPADIYFGPKGDGHLKIWLDDATFNEGLYGTFPGKFFGATVWGHMKLIADATAVPEPAGLAMFGLSLLAVGGLASRRRKGSK